MLEHSIQTGEIKPGNTTLIRCLCILGLFAQHGKIDEHAQHFNAVFGVSKNISATDSIAELLAAFTNSMVPEAVRKIAITSYGIARDGHSDSRVPVSW